MTHELLETDSISIEKALTVLTTARVLSFDVISGSAECFNYIYSLSP